MFKVKLVDKSGEDLGEKSINETQQETSEIQRKFDDKEKNEPHNESSKYFSLSSNPNKNCGSQEICQPNDSSDQNYHFKSDDPLNFKCDVFLRYFIFKKFAEQLFRDQLMDENKKFYDLFCFNFYIKKVFLKRARKRYKASTFLKLKISSRR